MNLRYKFALTAVLLLWTFGADGQTEYDVQPVADIGVGSTVWALETCEPVDNEYTYTVTDNGSQMQIWSPDKRYDVISRGDTLLYTCNESRTYRVAFNRGMICGLRSDEAVGMSFSLEGRMFQAEIIAGSGTAVVYPAVKGKLTERHGDVPVDATLCHDISTMRWYLSGDKLMPIDSIPEALIFETSIDTYRIMTDEDPFPRGVKRITTTRLDGNVIEQDSVAWVRCLSAADVAERSRRQRPGGDRDRDDTPGGNGIAGDDIEVTVGTDAITVTCRESGPIAAVALITDMLGREYMKVAVELTAAGCHININVLPRGEYLLEVVTDDGMRRALKFTR